MLKDSRPVRGTGRRSKSEFWPRGVSQKQNNVWEPESDSDKSKPIVWIFSDSQLRPVVQGDVQLPDDHFQFGVNCTPGGTCWHVQQELEAFENDISPDVIVLAVGTNNIHNKKHKGSVMKGLVGDCEMFRRLVKAAAKKYPHSKIVATSIIPRLDSWNTYVPRYNEHFRVVCKEEAIKWLDFSEHFPTTKLKLWAWDGLHISECSGLPLYLTLLRDRLIKFTGTRPSRRLKSVIVKCSGAVLS